MVCLARGESWLTSDLVEVVDLGRFNDGIFPFYPVDRVPFWPGD